MSLLVADAGEGILTQSRQVSQEGSSNTCDSMQAVCVYQICALLLPPNHPLKAAAGALAAQLCVSVCMHICDCVCMCVCETAALAVVKGRFSMLRTKRYSS